MWTIFSCGVATTLCPLISMIRCPTRTPPLSAIPPRIRLQICQSKARLPLLGKELGVIRRLSFLEPSAPCLLLSEKLPQLGFGHLNNFVSLHKKEGPLCPHGYLIHTVYTGNLAHPWIPHGLNSDYSASQLGPGKMGCLGLLPSCQCVQTVGLYASGEYYLPRSPVRLKGQTD